MEYRIIFAGEVLPGHEVHTVKQELMRRLKLPQERADKLFNGRPRIIKKGLDEAGARKYLKGMNKIGVLVKVDPPLPASKPGLELEPQNKEVIAPVAGTSAASSTSKPRSHNPYKPPTANQNALFCRSCGAKVAPRQAKCRACGANQELGKPRSKYVAAVLALFFGWIGAHRIYLGQWWGLLYLLLYIVMWPVAIIEAIVFLFTSKERWDERYGNVKGSGAAVVVVVLIGGVMLMGILAAIAIPAYQDYTMRAKVSQVISETDSYREQIEAFVIRTGRAPSSNSELGFSDTIQFANVSAVTIRPGGVMTIEFEGAASLDKRTLIWTPDISSNKVSWRCDGGTLQNRFRPSNCRNKSEPAASTDSGRSSQTVTSASGLVSITLPAGRWEPQDLQEAELVYVDQKEDIVLVVVSESKQDFAPDVDLHEFTNMLIEVAFTDYSEAKFERYGKHPIHGMDAQLFDFSGYSEKVAVEGLVAAVEGRNDYYKVMAWTSKSNFELKYDKILTMLESFKEHPR
jgi:Tfp pilus assembly major pilin PilA/ribosomal protein L40E